jgi:metal-responsive CopG/Arc/MetJ family transcriptional regulator
MDDTNNKPRRRAGRPRLGKTKVMFSIKPFLVEQMDLDARKKGVNRSDWLESAIHSYLVNRKFRGL